MVQPNFGAILPITHWLLWLLTRINRTMPKDKGGKSFFSLFYILYRSILTIFQAFLSITGQHSKQSAQRGNSERRISTYFEQRWNIVHLLPLKGTKVGIDWKVHKISPNAEKWERTSLHFNFSLQQQINWRWWEIHRILIF